MHSPKSLLKELDTEQEEKLINWSINIIYYNFNTYFMSGRIIASVRQIEIPRENLIMRVK